MTKKPQPKKRIREIHFVQTEQWEWTCYILNDKKGPRGRGSSPQEAELHLLRQVSGLSGQKWQEEHGHNRAKR